MLRVIEEREMQREDVNDEMLKMRGAPEVRRQRERWAVMESKDKQEKIKICLLIPGPDAVRFYITMATNPWPK